MKTLAPYRLTVVAVCLSVVSLFSNVSAAAAAGPTPTSAQPVIVQAFSQSDFLADTNADRVANGIAPLQLNSQLDAAALAKAEDMVANNYWAHFRPSDGKTPWDFITEAGYNYKVAGENLAKGFRTPGGITNAWMNSPEHRANLLSAKYTDVGFASIYGVIDGQTVLLTVQEFGSR